MKEKLLQQVSGIDERDGIEYAYPDGKYTGALIIRSNRLSKNNKAKAKKIA